MIKTNLFIFASERPKRSGERTASKPQFSDSILLPKKSSFETSYHTIFLYRMPLSLHLLENNSHFRFQHQSLQLIEGETPLTEEEAYAIFVSFSFVDDNHLSFLIMNRKKNLKMKEKQSPRKLIAQQKL